MKDAANVSGFIPAAFTAKKQRILQQLNVPRDEYDDLSPKGSVDAEIADFVNEINSYEGLVTTSSCSGRISVFLEGKKHQAIPKVDDEHTQPENVLKNQNLMSLKEVELNNEIHRSTLPRNPASKGGKGGGGHWLFVSHSPLSSVRGSTITTDQPQESRQSLYELFQLKPMESNVIPSYNATGTRLVHFKFEPMILHILAANLSTAQQVLTAALQCGFRESGASGLPTSTSTPTASQNPISLAIRATGLAFDNIIGYAESAMAASKLDMHDEPSVTDNTHAIVSEEHLSLLVTIASEKFAINKDRTAKFRALLARAFESRSTTAGPSGGCEQEANRNEPVWEDKAARRARKRDEGLKRKTELQQSNGAEGISVQDTIATWLYDQDV